MLCRRPISFIKKRIGYIYFIITHLNNKIMEDYKTRMINELNELVERIKKLFAFIGSKEFESLVDDEQQDLREQYIHMREYEVVLRRRCKRAGLFNS